MSPTRKPPKNTTAIGDAAGIAGKTGRTAHPALPAEMEVRDPASAAHASKGQALAEQMRHNPNKPGEYGGAADPKLEAGAHLDISKQDGAGALSELADSDKTADSTLREEHPPVRQGVLANDRSFPGVAPLTTNQGVPVAENQSSLKAGVRGPSLLEDFILREKLTHFDHERIPERVVHARGSGAHGYFEATEDLSEYTRATVFRPGKRTPVFARFSTVAGERGSFDCARDVRGFAVKFYSDEGNWDLVGNNIPVFFIQDAMKFPDLVHAVKPEPHNAMPQAASAHDTYWDFVSLMPESTHMLCWQMSDRAIPRSLRMMQGFGVHTFRLVNDEGRSTFVKFHWIPTAGVHSLVWDEAVKVNGADPDFHRRDLWEAIEAGAFPEWQLAVQLFTEEQAEQWSFDILDPTKIVPEELCPLRVVGRMVLDRNPDNFFAETEQVAFCTANVIPGIDFSNDPLLAGRHHSYLDTQLLRLGGPNFHELPINAPLAPIANNQRDGLRRHTINRGKVAYEPNSLGGGCPFQAGMKGYVSYPAEIAEDHKLRGKPEKFSEHYNQARLFVQSLSEPEARHMEGGFRFELSKVSVPAVRERVIANLRHVDDAMAARLAEALGVNLDEPIPLAIEAAPEPEVVRSERLSQTAFPGNGSIAARRIAILLAAGVRGEGLMERARELGAQGAAVKFVAPRLGTVDAEGQALPVDVTYENSPSVLFDAVILPADADSLRAFSLLGHAKDFVKEQYRHCKTIGLVGATGGAAEALAGLGVMVDEAWPGSLAGVIELDASESFQQAVAQHRHFTRETDPPIV